MNDLRADETGRARRWRLAVIAVVVALLVGSGLVVGAIGDRRVDAEMARIRSAAPIAMVDPSTYTLAVLGPGPDPVTDALGTDASLAGLRRDDGSWCLTLTVARLLSRESIHVTLGRDGRFAEVPRCAPA